MEIINGSMVFDESEFGQTAYKRAYAIPKPAEDDIFRKKVQFVRDQLTSIAPAADWNNRGIDRVTDLARILVNAGITDLWALNIYPVDYYIRRLSGYAVSDAGVISEGSWILDPHRAYAFEYYGRNIGFLGESDAPMNAPFLDLKPTGFAIGFSAEGHGHIDYVVRPNAQNNALEIVPIWASSSDASEIRGSILSTVGFFAMALPIAGVGLGAIIGNAILPAAVTSAYPMAASIVGNVALSTALNGGNVESAVRNVLVSAASGYAGAQTGAFVSSATDSALVGALAGSVTQAALSGSDIKMALATAGIKQGISYYDQVTNPQQANATVDFFAGTFEPVSSASLTNPQGGIMDQTFNYSIDFLNSPDYFDDFAQNYEFSYDSVFGNDPFAGYGFGSDPFSVPQYNFGFDPDIGLTTFDTSAGLEAFDWSQFSTPVFAYDYPVTESQFTGFENVFSVTNTGGTIPSTNPLPSVPPNKDSDIWKPTQVIQAVSAAALAVIGLIKAYRSLDRPKINTTARKVNPDGSVSVITDNGLVSTRSPNGQIVSTKPPVGVPQSTLNGNTVVNNGDGTYTVVSPSGQSATYPYDRATGNTGGLDISPGLIALAVGAFFLLSK